MRKFLCWLGLHKWHEDERIVVYDDWSGSVERSFSTCAACGRTRERYHFNGDT